MESASERLLLDCCALLNLYATRRITHILAAFPVPTAVPQVVMDNEALWVGSGPRNDPAADYERVDLHPFVEAATIEIVTPTSELEIALVVELAADLGDGEAMSGALAAHRGYAVVTDDGMAIRALSRNAPAVKVRSTASLMKQWAETCCVSAAELAEALQLIERRASFQPPRRDPLRLWWNEARAGRGSR